MDECALEEITNYRSSLADLSCNSKPLINVLTILAEENIKHASQIVKVIADHVLTVPPDSKLPSLYLVDSIIKNVREQYLPLFSAQIVSIFASVFEKVDENTRMLLYKLRQTWNEIFPNKTLYAIDMRVKQMDPAWPITAQPPPQSIHVNPKFLDQNSMQKSLDQSSLLVQQEENRLKAQQNEVLKQLFVKQEQLRLIEQKKMELAKQLCHTEITADIPPSQTNADPLLAAKLHNSKLNQRDPRLQKNAIASVLKKNLAQSQLGLRDKPSPPPSAQPSPPLRTTAAPVEHKVQEPKLCKPPEPVIKEASKPVTKEASKPVTKEAPKPVIKEAPKPTPDLPQPASQAPKSNGTSSSDKTDKKLVAEKSSPSKRESSTSPSSKKRRKIEIDPKKETKEPAKVSPKKLPKEKGSKRSSPKKVCKKHDGSHSKSSHKSDRTEKGNKDKKVDNISDSSKSKQLSEGSKGKSDLADGRDAELKNKRDLRDDSKENKDRLPEKKKHKEDKRKDSDTDSLFGQEDQDYRELNKTNDNHDKHKGWAMYKAAHPDEFKIPKRQTSQCVEIQAIIQEQKKKLEALRSENARIFPNRFPIEYDKLGRPRLHRMQRNQRFSYPSAFEHRDNDMRYHSPVESMRFENIFLSSLMSDPNDVLRQVEEQHRLGRITENEKNDIYRIMEHNTEEYRKLKSFGNVLGSQVWGVLRNSEKKYNLPNTRLHGPVPVSHDVCTFRLDNKSRIIHFIEDRAVVLMDNDEPKELVFRGEPIQVFISGLKPITLRFDGNAVDFELEGKRCTMKLGAPSRELYINGKSYEGKFGGEAFDVFLYGKIHRVALSGPAPQVQVSERPAHELYQKILARNRNVKRDMPPSRDNKGDYGQGEGVLRDHSNAMPFDVDMRAGQRGGGMAKDMDWRQVEAANDRFPDNFPPGGTPFDDKDLNYRNSSQNYNKWDKVDGDFRNKSHHPEWQKFPQFREMEGNYSPHGTPPQEDWEHSPRAFQEDQRPYEPKSRQWMQRDFNQGPADSSKPEASNMFSTRRSSPHPFEPHQNFRERGPPGPRPLLRPGFHPIPNRPDGDNHFPRLPHLPRPPMPPLQWMNNPQSAPQQQAPILQPPPMLRMPLLGMPPGVPPLAMQMPLRNQMMPSFPPTADVNPALNTAGVVVAAQQGGVPDSSTTTTTVPALPALDIGTLFSKLIAAGIISKSEEESDKTADQTKESKKEDSDTKASESTTENAPDLNEEQVPPIPLKLVNLKIRYSGVISALYRGSQCASCGMRFKEIQGERYSRHLDWHFRANRREKDGVKKAFSRKWYYEIEDWVQFEEFEDFEERARSFFDLQADEQFQMETDVEVPSVPVSGQETEACVVCGELFQLFWVEEEEEWHLRNAVRHEDQAYHPSCYEDYKKSLEPPKEDVKNESTQDEETEMEVDEKPEIKLEPKEEEEEVVDPDEITEEELNQITEEVSKVIETMTESVIDQFDKVEEEVESELDISTVKIEVEEEIELQGQPGEEEIIGVITESDAEFEEKPVDESERIVLQSGGIVMKVRAESLKPASPAMDCSVSKEVDSKAAATSENNEGEEEEEEFRPPTPDPRFQVLPPVQKGTELSGLCIIM